MPKISVVMPVYNGEKYLKEAIDSILNQTFIDFEFIIINDCSNDRTEEIIQSYADERIVYIKNDKNMGVAATLNRGIDIAKGEYIARMDADDISLPERFVKQVEFMDKHCNIAVCGSEVELISETEIKETYTVFGSENMKINLLFSSCLAHPAVMMRNSIIQSEQYRYDKEFDKIEDYELWTRVNMKYDIDNVPKVLFRYRIHSNQVTQNYTEKHLERLRILKKRQLENLGIEYTECEYEAFYDFCTRKIDYNSELIELAGLFDKIYNTNKRTKIFDERLLKDYLKGILINSFQNQKNITIADLKGKCKIVKRSDIMKREIMAKTRKYLKRK